MLNKETAQEISELCVEKIDWTIVGLEGGTVTIFTGKDRYYASYGTEGSDPITETSKSKEPGNARWFERDGTVSSDHPVICTVSVHDGKLRRTFVTCRPCSMRKPTKLLQYGT